MKFHSQQNCNKCGICLSVCPVYKALCQEHASPRARVQLIKRYQEGTLLSSVDLKEIMDKCLMCGSCAAVCPSGVDHYERFMEMRAEMTRNHGGEPAVKSLVFLLAREYRLRLASGVARFSRRMVPEAFTKKYQLGNIPVNRFPRLNSTPFRRAVPAVNPPRGASKGRVAYFTGCATNYLFDTTGAAVIQQLNTLGYEVVVPKKQTCCSIPMLFHGALSAAGENIVANVACLDMNAVSAVIVDCPTCGAALKKEYPALVDKLGLDGDAVQRIADKVVDIVTFLKRKMDVTTLVPRSDEKTRVTYHMPCHLKNSLAELNHTQEMLATLPGVDYVPTPDTDACCGGGGTFFYEFPDVSRKMVTQKTAHATDTGASFWVTDCPVCRINLSGNLKENDDLQVIHPVELLKRCFSFPDVRP